MNSEVVIYKKLRFDEPKNSKKMLELFEKNDFKAIHEYLKNANPLRKEDKALYVTSDIIDLIYGLTLLFENKTITLKTIRKIADEFFNGSDLLVFLVTYWIQNLTLFENTQTSKKNGLLFMSCLPSPKARLYARLGSEYYREIDFTENKRCKVIETLWLKQLYRGVPQDAFLPVLRKLLDDIMDILSDSELIGDFLLSFVQQKNFKFGIFAIEGVAKLMLEKNFSYPEFYEQLYQMLPSLIVLPSKESGNFVHKLDMYMSSTHVPAYIIAAFAKRIARMQLAADLEICSLLLGVLRNMYSYHAVVREMCNRDEPKKLDFDPYDETASLKDCNASESSLWEVAPMFKHYQAMIPKKVDFVEAVSKKVVMDPAPLQPLDSDEMFEKFFTKGGKIQHINNCPISYSKISDDVWNL